jgi:hypothetical protein
MYEESKNRLRVKKKKYHKNGTIKKTQKIKFGVEEDSYSTQKKYTQQAQPERRC